jgi:hypothetical protein
VLGLNMPLSMLSFQKTETEICVSSPPANPTASYQTSESCPSKSIYKEVSVWGKCVSKCPCHFRCAHSPSVFILAPFLWTRGWVDLGSDFMPFSAYIHPSAIPIFPPCSPFSYETLNLKNI